jgi:hypothetical protein
MPWMRAHGHRRRRGAGSSLARAAFRSGNKEGEAVRAVVLSEFGPPGNAAEAHAAIEARATIGKTLLRTRAAAVR